MDVAQITRESALETLRMWHRLMMENGFPRAAVDDAVRDFAAGLEPAAGQPMPTILSPVEGRA
jgi:hypothetical protein